MDLPTVESLTAHRRNQEESLRNLFSQLQADIVRTIAGARVYARSKNVVFEEVRSDSVYGYLCADGDGLQIAYRTRDDDFDDARTGVATTGEAYDPIYSVRALPDCSEIWLRKLAQPEVLQSLFDDLVQRLSTDRDEADAAIAAIQAALNTPLRESHDAVAAVARELGYRDVLLAWRLAQTAVQIDPAVAVARASSLLEMLFRHILKTMNEPDPTGSQNIQSLLKPTLRALSLSAETLREDDLRNAIRGVTTVVQNIGSLRTHGNVAHGQPPNTAADTVAEARLAVDLAGAIATFLMERTRTAAARP